MRDSKEHRLELGALLHAAASAMGVELDTQILARNAAGMRQHTIR